MGGGGRGVVRGCGHLLAGVVLVLLLALHAVVDVRAGQRGVEVEVAVAVHAAGVALLAGQGYCCV